MNTAVSGTFPTKATAAAAICMLRKSAATGQLVDLAPARTPADNPPHGTSYGQGVPDQVRVTAQSQRQSP